MKGRAGCHAARSEASGGKNFGLRPQMQRAALHDTLLLGLPLPPLVEQGFFALLGLVKRRPK